MKKEILIFAVLSVILQGEARGIDIIAKGVGARALSLGRAFIGLADDSGAVFINPAALAFSKKPNLTNQYAAPAENAQHLAFGGSLPDLLGGAIGLGYNNFTNFGVIDIRTGDTADQINQDIILSYARRLNDNLALGGALKYYIRGFSRDISPDAKASGSDFDLSLKYNPRQWLGLGAVLQHILPENLGGRITKGSGAVEGIRASYKAGLSAKLWGDNSLLGRKDQTLLLNFDIESGASPALLHLGAEWSPVKYFSLRAGIDQTPGKTDVQVVSNPTFGIGLKYGGIAFDYAYYQLGGGINRTEHYFSFSYFRPEDVKIVKVVSTAEAANILKLKSFRDVPAAYWVREEIEILAALGIMPGFPDGTFKPDDYIKRGELAEILKTAGPVERPQAPATRLEGVIMLVRFANLSGGRVIVSPYPDIPGRHWAAEYVTMAKEAGLLKFIGDKFEPRRKLTRAEAAMLLFQTKFVQDKLKNYELDGGGKNVL